ncbi:MAG: hypothetical protein QG628_395 [Patescibacteria group bacterium]|nr:hypothetical protein [Patescibacteria group bacterium]
MKKIKTPGPGQSEMFVQGSVDRHLEMPAHVDSIQTQGPETTLVSDSTQFPSVDLAERAVELDKALLALGKHSQRTGLQIAGAESSTLRRGIEDRYGDATDQVVEGAANSKDRLMTQAKQHFARAIGMQAMVASGMQTDTDAKQSTKEDFGQFLQRYADARNAPARKTMRTKMQKTQREQGKIRKVS